MAVNNRINITIVGFGSYGRMIGKKYAKNPRFNIKAILDPDVDLPDLPVFAKNIPIQTSPKDWKKKFGKVQESDVFDLCVHEEILTEIILDLAEIGAKNFIFPKPIATNKKRLAVLEEIIKKQKLNVAVASQWYYSKLTAELANVARKTGMIKKVKVNFSHFFDQSRAGKYTPITAMLPHVIQILHSANLVSLEHLHFNVELCSPDKLSLVGKDAKKDLAVEIDIDIAAPKKCQKVEIYFSKSSKIIEADFLGIFEFETFLEYPYLFADGRIIPIIEDPLEAMIEGVVNYFKNVGNKGLTKKTLDFSKYLPVAQKVAEIATQAEMSVAVIGGGIFGALSAVELAKKGFQVTIFEKNSDLLLGASLVNQCRIHMGYHYPRDKDTARLTNMAQKEFVKLFPNAVVGGNFENFYCIAKDGSLTSAEDYESFCKDLKLPFKKTWPHELKLNKNKISICFNVPERIFDVRHLRRNIYKLLEKHRNIRLELLSGVTKVEKQGDFFRVDYCRQKSMHTQKFGAVINATYSRLNEVNKLSGVPLQEYQYEVCEMPVVSGPWKKPVGIAIMDGPFFGIMPFGFSKEYLLYDVELSVLERRTADIPNFKTTIAKHNDPAIRAARFKTYVEKMKKIIPEVGRCQYLYSLYTVRIVLPKKDATDARPTIIENPIPGFWYMFSGKIATSVPLSRSLALKVEKFFRERSGGTEPI